MAHPRRLTVVLAVAVVLAAAAVVASLLVGSDGDDAPRIAPVADPLGEALRYADPAAPAALVLPTAAQGPAKRGLDALTATLPLADLARGQVEGSLRDVLGLDWRALVRRTAREPLVAWGPVDRSLARVSAALAVPDGDVVSGRLDDAADEDRAVRSGTHRGFALWRVGGRALALRGQVVVLAPDLTGVRAALDRAAAGTGLSRAALRERALGLGDGAGALALLDARAVAARALGPGPLARAPWLSALGRGAVELRAGRDGLDVRARAQLAPALPTTDLPLARGAAPPAARGAGLGPVVVGLRDPGQALRTLRAGLAPQPAAALDAAAKQADRLLGLDLDAELIDRLRGTLSLVVGRALDVVVARGELSDPGGVAGALDRAGTLARLGGLADLAGVDTGGYAVDASDDRVRLARDGRPLGVAALRGDALVASNDARADIDAAAGARPVAVPRGAAGALLVTTDAPRLAAALVPRLGLPSLALSLLGPLGDPWLSVEASDELLELRARVPVEG